MEEYLKTLLGQIRCKRAREFVGEEIRGHLEDQIQENQAGGMSRDEAAAEAIRDMGDPVETGVMLDGIHRPRVSWGMVALMAAVSVLSIVIHTGTEQKLAEAEYATYRVSPSMAAAVAAGFVLMFLVYRIDYSFIARHARLIGALFLGIVICGIAGGGATYGGQYQFVLPIVGRRVATFPLMMLYVPVYGGVLYQYYGSGYAGLMKAFLWLLVPVLFAFRLPCLSLAALLFFMLSALLSVAVWRGWFKIEKKRFLAGYWGAALGLPAPLLWLAARLHLLAEYQTMRLQAFFGNSGEGGDYLSARLREYLAGSRLLGDSGQDVATIPVDFASDHILVYLNVTYGIAAAFAVCAVLALVTVKVFRISFGQPNQPGMMMGCGCGIVFLANTVFNILQSTGYIPAAQTFLPFFSRGGTGVLVNYILIGIILSIYRYKDILPPDPKVQTPRNAGA